ncbi:uncharacterized protein LOC134445147 [Engraulis encrasicolus]|uniref:uncharacterized protein LOC134445147 n=1 Tax=Engraulis encrasicolus TaxID=184585 RepID=UPI002FD491F0
MAASAQSKPLAHSAHVKASKDTGQAHSAQDDSPAVQLMAPSPKCEQRQTSRHARRPRSVHYQPSSESEDDHDTRERIPTLRPGQYDGTTPWTEFKHRFESCAKANHWTEKTKAIQLKFCLVGAAGAIVHKNPRSTQWGYRRLVEEVENAYGPSSEHAAAVAIELRQRIRKPGEALHSLRDDIYGKVSVAYCDRTEEEQDTIGVEVFTHAIGDAEIVQKLLEKRPQTLAKAYDIAHRYETTKRAASHVTALMHSGARGPPERKPCTTAMVRERVDGGETDILTAIPGANSRPVSHEFHRAAPRKTFKNAKWEEIRCHNCSGIGHIQRHCPSPRKTNRPTHQYTNASREGSEPTVLHFKTHGQEMNIHLMMYELDVCAVLDSGARRSVLPLHCYNAIHPEVRPALQPSTVKTLLGVGPGDVPVTGEVQLLVQINNRQVSVNFLVADIAGEEALLGHPFLTQAQARLDFGTNRIILFGEEVPYFNTVSQPKIQAVRVSRTVVVEAGVEYVIRGKIPVKRRVEGEVMLTPTRGFVGRHKVLVARVLLQAQHAKGVPLRVFNPGNAPVTIRKGAIAGILQPAHALPPSATTAMAELPEHGDIPLHLRELYNQSAAELDQEQQPQLAQLLCKYSTVFSTGPTDLGRTSLVQHDIMVRPGAAVKQQPRRMAWEKQRDADQQIEQGLEAGVARRSNSSWASPLVMVRKKDGTYRLCVDYRALNDCTIKDAYPLPRIQDTLDTLSTAKWFSTLDLASGYWQVELTPRARRAAAFCTRNGLFEWNVMPFGLCNAPATFQRLMDRVLAGMQWETCLVYLDDIIVLGRNVPEMLHRLSQVFDRLLQANLKLKPAKCCLFRRQVAYLGHVVSEEGVASDPAKVQKVQEWPTPTSVQEVRQFVGLASYYRRFVQDFATVAGPLHALTKKYARFHWTAECQQAFDQLKRLLTTAPVLGYPLDQGNMVLDTDASDVGIGAVLSQVQLGRERVLAYGSRRLSKTEQNYCTTRRELLAVVEFTSHFRQYLLGRSFTVRTDHSSLRWLTKMREPEGQLARWLERLGEYDFNIVHRPGRLHSNADSLSRPPCRQSCPCQLPGPSLYPRNVCHQAVQCDLDSAQIQTVQTPVGVGRHVTVRASAVGVDATSPDTPQFGGWSAQELQAAQEFDPDISPIKAWLEAGGERPPWTTISAHSPAAKAYWSQWRRLFVRGGILFRRFYCLDGAQFYPQVILPRVFWSDVKRQMHEGPVGGHFGTERMVTRLQTRYYWYQMRADVSLWCLTCKSCGSKARARKTPQAPMGTVRVGAPMERVALDIMGPLNETERRNSYVLVIQDYFTKWVEAFPLPNEKAETVAEVLASQWVCRFGAPHTIHSDQGRNFESEVFQKMCALFGVEKTRTTPFRPQSDGQVERFNSTLQKILATTAERCHWDWDLMIPYAVMAYRATRHSATGLTPNFMMFGREVCEPADLVTGLPPDPEDAPTAPEYVQRLRERLELAHQIARDALGESVERAKRQYDKNCCRTQYCIGDAVWYLIKGTRRVKNKVRKFLPSYEGPYFVLGQLDDLVYRIQKSPKTKVKVVHHDQLKAYRSRDPLDNAWVMEQAQAWTPVEVPPPPVATDSVALDLTDLFSSGDQESVLGTAGDDSAAAGSLPPTGSPEDDAADSGGEAGLLPPTGSSEDDAADSGGEATAQLPEQRSQRLRRRRRSPVRFGEWVD